MSDIVRKKIIVKGVVQGVGFRPNVYKLALENLIRGWVRNNSEGVLIEAEGIRGNIKKFTDNLREKKPPQSKINSISVSDIPIKKEKKFLILESGKTSAVSAMIPADLGICSDCREDILKKSDRRYKYPFTNCTNCGPRFTIVKKVPYDRSYTTMKKFKMCPECLREYSNPLDRRFHAQPNACGICGPKIRTEYKGKYLEGESALNIAADLIKKGGIAAVESLGGFHLACDAGNKKAVLKLRKAKNRMHKPFALMARNIKEAEKICYLNLKEKEVLKSAAAPVVMLKKRNKNLFQSAAPNLGSLGIMLPYTPLHEVLFKILREAGFENPLIMTSGNKRDEPIAKSFAEAKVKLSLIADIIVYHDRDIHNRVDDSVGFVSGGEFRLVRRSRGFVPSAIKLPISSDKEILACGADLKNTFCLVRGDEAFVSQHIGDLSEAGNQRFYAETIDKFKKLLGINPKLTAHDLHPDYYSSVYVKNIKGAAKKSVQHHLAHILSVAAENKIKGPMMGVALDGTGYGSDGKIWGCEFMEIDSGRAKRKAHMRYFQLPGGDIAASEIWRGALSLVKASSLDGNLQKKAGGFFKAVKKSHMDTLEKMMDLNINAPLTSGMGRLFDVVAFLAGIRTIADYEAQGPMELESLCENKPKSFYKFSISEEKGKLIIDPSPIISAIIKGGIKNGRAKLISEKFHLGVARMITDVFCKLRLKNDISRVALSGGVFQNKLILEWTIAALKEKGFDVYTNNKIPSNDACISLGQAFAVISGVREVED